MNRDEIKNTVVEFSKKGIVFSLNGEDVKVKAPEDEDIDVVFLKENKAAIIAFMRGDNAPPGAVCCECDTPAMFISPGGYTYCSIHYQCRRGHRPVWRLDCDKGIWLCACYWEHQTIIQEEGSSIKYIPLTLPALPRNQCPHHTMMLQQDGSSARQKRGPLCGQHATYHGWCEGHALSHDILELGANLGYPSINVNEYRGILDGCANWEGYAEIAPKKWLVSDITVIRATFSSR